MWHSLVQIKARCKPILSLFGVTQGLQIQKALCGAWRVVAQANALTREEKAANGVKDLALDSADIKGQLPVL